MKAERVVKSIRKTQDLLLQPACSNERFDMLIAKLRFKF